MGEIPDPDRAVAQYYPPFSLIKTTPCRLPKNPLGEGRILGGVRGGALDSRRVGNGALVPYRSPFFVPAFRAPGHAELHLPRLWSARASGQLALPHEGCPCRRSRDRASERTAYRLYVLSSSAISLPKASDVRSTCLAFTFTPASSESNKDPSLKLTIEAERPVMRTTCGRQGRMDHRQRPVPGDETLFACLAVVHLAKDRGECFGPSSLVAHMTATGARKKRSCIVGEVRVELLLDSPGCLPPRRRLYRLEVETIRGALADQPFDLRGDLDPELFFEAPFLAVAFASASESFPRLSSSLASAKSWASFQNRRPSSNCSLTFGRSSSFGTVLITDLPPTFFEMIQPPCPGCPGSAQTHIGLPQRRYR